MNHLFEPVSATEIITRIDRVQANTQPKWGKMNAAQMIAHCQVPFEVFFEEKEVKRPLMGILFGKMAKKKLFDNKPWPKSLPTGREFVVADPRNLVQEKIKLTEWIRRFTSEGTKKEGPVHPFFGKLSTEEWSMLAYKHLDHHLQQFGV